MDPPLTIVGYVERVEVISRGRGIREFPRLVAIYGPGKWRKLKGRAVVRLPNESVVRAEIHWYEAHGIGIKEPKIKRLLD